MLSGGQVQTITATVGHAADLFDEDELVPLLAPLSMSDTTVAMQDWRRHADAIKNDDTAAPDEPPSTLHLSKVCNLPVTVCCHDVAVEDEVAAALMRVVRGPNDLASTTRGLLEFLQKATAVESTYLTVIHWEDAKQEILVANNTGALVIDAGLLVDWCDTLCRRALLGGPNVTADVPGVYGDSVAARELGLVCYVSVPVTLPDGSVFGTLCGASGKGTELGDDTIGMFEFAASLIAGQLHRDRRVSEARERAQAAERRFRSQTLALAAAQHKLKTPLTVLTGWADMLDQRDELTAEQWASGAAAMQRQVQHLRDAVDTLLVTALADREPTVELRVLDIAPVLTGVMADHERATPARRWVSAVSGPLFVAADPAALEQAVAHLLDNAVKYSDDDTSVCLEARRVDNEVVIVVSDEGVGLPEDVSGLFEAFTRDGESRADSVGLGLYIVRSVAAAHHGTVTAARRPAGGSEFSIHLPASVM